MKAVILVGGEGTRLRPLTCNIPKAVVPVLNRPFLEHLLRYLKQHGITDVILAVGYNPEPIQACLGNGASLGVKLTYIVEKSPLGTAGAVKNAEALLDGTFIVFNGDVLTEIDLTEMIHRHNAAKPEVTIALTPVDNPTIYGVVETDCRGMVRRFIEKPTQDKVTTNMINAGIYILEPDVLKHIPVATRFMFEHHVFPNLMESGAPVLGYLSAAYWIDIGTPEKYLKVHDDLLLRWGDGAVRIEGESQIHPAAQLRGPILLGEGCVIAAGASIKGPTVLGAGCRIEPGAVVAGSVLWGGVQVGAGAVIRRCILGSGNRVVGGELEGSILGDNVTVSRESRLAPGARVWPDGHVEIDEPLK